MLPSDLSVRTFSYFSEWKNNNNDILTDFQLEALYFVIFSFAQVVLAMTCDTGVTKLPNKPTGGGDDL